MLSISHPVQLILPILPVQPEWDHRDRFVRTVHPGPLVELEDLVSHRRHYEFGRAELLGYAVLYGHQH